MSSTLIKSVIILSISMIVYSEDNYHEVTHKAILAPSINPSTNSPIIRPDLRIPIDNLCKNKITARYHCMIKLLSCRIIAAINPHHNFSQLYSS